MAPDTPCAQGFYRPGQYQPDQSVGYLMRRVLSSMLAQIDADMATEDMTYVQWLPLYKLARGEGASMAALARDLGIDPAALTCSIDRLEIKGLLRRERSATDRRVVQLVLTPAGEQAAERMAPVMANVLNRHLQGFSEAEWQALLDLLRRMLANGQAGDASSNPSERDPR